MSTSEAQANDSELDHKGDSGLSEIYQIFEMLIFGTKNKAIKVDDSKIITIKSYFFGMKKTIGDYGWPDCQTNDISITCKKAYDSVSFNTIQGKLTVDTFADTNQLNSVQFGIYNCKKRSDSLIN